MNKAIISDSLSLGVYFKPKAQPALPSRLIADSLSLGVYYRPSKQPAADASIVMGALSLGTEIPEQRFEDAVVTRGQRYDFHYNG